MVICLKRGAALHIAQLMPLPLTVSCFSKIQTGFTFWYWLTQVVLEKRPLNGCSVLAHLSGPGQGPLNGCVCASATFTSHPHSMTTSADVAARASAVAMTGPNFSGPGGNHAPHSFAHVMSYWNKVRKHQHTNSDQTVFLTAKNC